MDLFCTVPFQHFSSTNVSESGTSVSERTRLMDLSSAAALTRVSTYAQLLLNGRRRHQNLALTAARGQGDSGPRPSGQSSWNAVDRRAMGLGGGGWGGGGGVIFALAESHFEKDAAFQDLFI